MKMLDFEVSDRGIDGVTLMVQAPGIIAKLKKHGPGNHAVVRKFEKLLGTPSV